MLTNKQPVCVTVAYFIKLSLLCFEVCAEVITGIYLSSGFKLDRVLRSLSNGQSGLP